MSESAAGEEKKRRKVETERGVEAAESFTSAAMATHESGEDAEHRDERKNKQNGSRKLMQRHKREGV